MSSWSAQLDAIAKGQPINRKRGGSATFLPSAAAANVPVSSSSSGAASSSSVSSKRQATLSDDGTRSHPYVLPITEPDLQLLVDDAVALNRGERFRFGELLVVPKRVALNLDSLNAQLRHGVAEEVAKWAHYNPSTSATVHVDVFVWERLVYQGLAKKYPHKEMVKDRAITLAFDSFAALDALVDRDVLPHVVVGTTRSIHPYIDVANSSRRFTVKYDHAKSLLSVTIPIAESDKASGTATWTWF